MFVMDSCWMGGQVRKDPAISLCSPSLGNYTW